MGGNDDVLGQALVGRAMEAQRGRGRRGRWRLADMTDAHPGKRRASRPTALLACLLVGSASLACSQSDIRGTYRVEILIEQARAPIDAILVLTSTHLDIESLPHEARGSAGEGSGDYQADPNSCLILPAQDPNDDAPRSVTFFEARIRAGEALVPFSIFENREQRMEVTKLQLFANALGGEITFHEPEGKRPGHLIGDRLDGPAGEHCIDAMGKFYARIQELAKFE